jgi:multiphosphoryl transfer protein
LPDVEQQTIDDVNAEIERLETAVAAAAAEIQAVAARSQPARWPDEAAIFDAHLLILQDPDLQAAAQQHISRQQVNAEFAWQSAVEQVAADYLDLEDDYMRNRAADVLDVGKRVLHQLMDLEAPSLDFDSRSFWWPPISIPRIRPGSTRSMCRAFAPSEAALPPTAPFWRGRLGIPAIVGLGHELGVLEPGQVVGMDGSSGQLWLKPTRRSKSSSKNSGPNGWRSRRRLKRPARGKRVTQDGHRVESRGQYRRLHDVAVALEYGAEGVGCSAPSSSLWSGIVRPMKQSSWRLSTGGG